MNPQQKKVVIGVAGYTKNISKNAIKSVEEAGGLMTDNINDVLKIIEP